MADSVTTSDGSDIKEAQRFAFSATYRSADNDPFTHIIKIAVSEDKTAHLNELRKASSKLQEQINASLTTRMEEDKVREASGGQAEGQKKAKVDEAEEEDNYGVEVAEEGE